MAVSQFDIQQLPGRHAQIVADHHPDDPAVGDDKGRACEILAYIFKKRGDTGFEIIETFSLGGVEGVDLLPPLQKKIRAGFPDMIKGLPIPGSHIDFIKPGIRTDFFFRANEGCRVPATRKVAGIDLIKLDFGKGVFPEQSLVHPGLIQRDIGLPDESLCLVSLYLSVAQQENAGAGDGTLFEGVFLERF